jgi:hypothetical protein
MALARDVAGTVPTGAASGRIDRGTQSANMAVLRGGSHISGEAEAMELADRVMHLERKVERHDEAIERIDGWQKTQNGTLQRIDAKIDKLVYWIMGEMAAVILLAASIFLRR